MSQVKKLMTATGTDHATAKHYLEAFDNNYEMALSMFLENQPSQNQEASDAALAAALATTDGAGPSNSSSSSNSQSVPIVPSEEDEVRPPIPRKFEVLCPQEPPITSFVRQRTVQFRDFEQETRAQERLLGLKGGVFNSGDIPKLSAGDNDDSSERSKHQQRLERLFKPPLDLLFRGTFFQARDEGTKIRKWLLVNIQDNGNFGCFALNRDIWNHNHIRKLVKEHFLLWQATSDSELGKMYMRFYKVTTFPYIAFIDPRTGELLNTYINKIDSKVEDFVNYLQCSMRDYGDSPIDDCDSSTDSITVKNDSSEGTSNGVKRKETDDEDRENSKKLKRSNGANIHSKSITDINEEDQIKIAIAKSLKANEASDSDEDEDLFFGCNDSAESNSFCESRVKNSSTEVSPDKKENLLVQDSSSSEITKSSAADEEVDWKKLCESFCGSPECNIVFRLPDGERMNVSLPSTAPLQVIYEYLKPRGFIPPTFRAFTSWPRKDLFNEDPSISLKDAGLAARDTIILQKE